MTHNGQRVYYLIALFNIAAVSVGLYLTHRVTTMFERSIAGNTAADQHRNYLNVFHSRPLSFRPHGRTCFPARGKPCPTRQYENVWLKVLVCYSRQNKEL